MPFVVAKSDRLSIKNWITDSGLRTKCKAVNENWESGLRTPQKC